jgi:nicotinamidase-related amidase
LIRHDSVSTREESMVLIIDIQKAMLKVIDDWKPIAAKVRQLTLAADRLDVPILLTEQYAKGLGGTIPEVLREIKSPQVFHKEHFSACLEPAFIPTIQSFHRSKIVVVGMETHVCVLQTCLDLIAAGYQVHLVADAVASRVIENRNIAIDQMREAGAIITSTEIVIFEWACQSNTDIFRKLLPIVK